MKDNAFTGVGVARADQVTFHPRQGYDPKEQILPQKSSASCPRAARRTPEHTDSLVPHTEGSGVAAITPMELDCRRCWHLIRFFTGYCCLQHGIFVAKGSARRLGAALVKPERETEGVGSFEGGGGEQERSIFARLQLYSSFRGQEWGSLQSKTTEV